MSANLPWLSVIALYDYLIIFHCLTQKRLIYNILVLSTILSIQSMRYVRIILKTLSLWFHYAPLLYTTIPLPIPSILLAVPRITLCLLKMCLAEIIYGSSLFWNRFWNCDLFGPNKSAHATDNWTFFLLIRPLKFQWKDSTNCPVFFLGFSQEIST